MEKNLTDNYEKQIYIGRDLFLKYDQDMLIKKYKLKNDHAYLYLNYIGTEYRKCRQPGLPLSGREITETTGRG